jgi:hypothetical protein
MFTNKQDNFFTAEETGFAADERGFFPQREKQREL